MNLTNDGRKRFIAAFEWRLDHEITHPLYGYRLLGRAQSLQKSVDMFFNFLPFRRLHVRFVRAHDASCPAQAHALR